MQLPGTHEISIAHTTSRIEALTDGVFAIVMTLMVFDIRIPIGTPDELWPSLSELWPAFFAYAISFVQLGIYWVGHRAQFNFIVREDHTLRWICLLFLALVALIPFSTHLLSSYLDQRVALGVYAANYVMVGLVLAWQWHHATSHSRLVAPNLAAGIVDAGFRRCLTAPILYAVAFVLSSASPGVTVALYALIPAFYLFPALIDRIWLVPYEE